MDKDEALKLAYEALEFDGFYGTQKQRAITAIKQALAAPVQEPVALGQEREAFEAWHDSFFVNKGHAAHHRFHDRDGYCIDDIQNQWKGWKERAKRTTPPAAQPAVPEGWKLVPVEPTHGMVKAFQDAMSLEFGMRTTAGYHARVYSAMLATAPEKGQP
jgi:hypothetical protein